MVTALVTGHSGFIGKNLVPSLTKQGAHVIGFSTRNGKDILDSDQVLEATKNVDVVYHLAAYAKPAASLQNPSQAVEVNVRGAFNILEACRRSEFHLIYPSTCEIYGDSAGPITEDHPLNPPNPYAASKAAADRLCYSYAKAYGIRVCILRLFNPYGPHQQLDKVIPTFYSQAVKGEPITVYGSGTDTRDYTYVDDVVEALSKASSVARSEAVNICTGRALTNLDVAIMVKKIANSGSQLKHAEYPKLFGGIRNQVGSYAKANQLMGWVPRTTFEEGFRKTVDWLQTLAQM